MKYETDGNLQSAFSGESQANRRYLFFAAKAEEEGYLQIARLFRAVAEAETVHARNHFTTLGGVGSIKDNLLAGSTGEHREFTRLYPPFIVQAEEEKNEKAGITFQYADKVERIHHQHFEKALEALKTGQKVEDKPYFVCQVCGNTVAGQAPDRCPVCGAAQSKFKLIE
jgi:rubrerythrin